MDVAESCLSGKRRIGISEKGKSLESPFLLGKA